MAFLSGWAGEAAKVIAGAAVDTWGSKKDKSGSSSSVTDTTPKQRLTTPKMPFDRMEAPAQTKAARVEDPEEYVNLWMRRMAQFAQGSQ